MGGKHHSLYIRTDPNSTANIGIPGQSIFIGSPGPTIYGLGPGAIDAGGLIVDMSQNFIVYLTTMQVQLE